VPGDTACGRKTASLFVVTKDESRKERWSRRIKRVDGTLERAEKDVPVGN